MTRSYLLPATLDELQSLDDPAAIGRLSHWLAWLLLRGHPVTRLDVPPGFSSSNVSTVAAQLEHAGAAIGRERIAPGERGAGAGAPTRLRMTLDHHGRAVRVAKDDPPPVPASLHARTTAAPGRAVNVRRAPAAPPDPRLDLLRPAPAAPVLGAPLRVVMIAETNGHPTICLRDESGRAWFATIDGEPAG